MLTEQQEEFLKKLADKGIEEEVAELARVAQSEIDNQKAQAKNEFIENLKRQKDEEFHQAVADFEATFEVK